MSARNMIMRSEDEGGSERHSDEILTESSVLPSSFESNSLLLYGNCVIKVETHDEETVLIQNTHSSELDRSGDLCGGDRIPCQRTNIETNLGLFVSTSVKRENTGAECDLPDELFHSEVDLKLEDVTQQEEQTSGDVSVSSVKRGETLSGDRHSTKDVERDLGAWSPVASASDGSYLSLPQISGCVDPKAHSKPEFSASSISAKVTENGRGKNLRRTSKNVCLESNKVFCRSSVLQNRMRISSRPYKSIAGVRAERRECNLKEHKNNPGKERRYKCNECGYGAVYMSKLIRHTRIHTGEKPFKCSECDYSASQKSTLIIHTRIHTGEKPFKCSECDYSAADKSTLNRHTRIHTGVKPFKCAVCDYSASEKCNLNRHTLIHSGEKPFKCAE